MFCCARQGMGVIIENYLEYINQELMKTNPNYVLSKKNCG